MNTPEERNANHSSVDAQSGSSVDTQCDVDWGNATPSQRCTRESGHSGAHVDSGGREFGTPEVPEEITEARDLLVTAMVNTDMADDAVTAAQDELDRAARVLTEARIARDLAGQGEADAKTAYVAVLRRHGYVQTADGPKPRA